MDYSDILDNDNLRAVYHEMIPSSPPAEGMISPDPASLSASPPSVPDPHLFLKETKKRHISLSADQKQKLRHAAHLQKTAKALEKLQPLIPPNFQPEQELRITFKSGKKALLGKELSLVATLTEPEVKYEPKPNTYYTIIFVDPDVPIREKPSEAEERLWVVSNILENDVFKGEYLQEYEPPSPAIGMGLHNCVGLLFEQEPGYIDLRTFEGNRKRWSCMRWAEKNKMRLIAANYWQTQDKH